MEKIPRDYAIILAVMEPCKFYTALEIWTKVYPYMTYSTSESIIRDLACMSGTAKYLYMIPKEQTEEGSNYYFKL